MYPKGKEVWWWAFSSTTKQLETLNDEMFLGKTGVRTVFNIQVSTCRQTRPAGRTLTRKRTRKRTRTRVRAHTHSARADRHPRWCMRTHSVCSCCRYCPVLTSPPTQSIRVRNLRQRCSFSLERSFRCSPSVMAAATPATVAPLTAGRSVEGKSVHRASWWLSGDFEHGHGERSIHGPPAGGQNSRQNDQVSAALRLAAA